MIFFFFKMREVAAFFYVDETVPRKVKTDEPGKRGQMLERP